MIVLLVICQKYFLLLQKSRDDQRDVESVVASHTEQRIWEDAAV